MTLSDQPASNTQTPQAVIQTIELTKRFATVIANNQISFEIGKGEIHGLLGENGAGKTTLAECLYGYYTPDGGQILFEGKPVEISSPKDAMNLGIGMVHQRFVLIRSFSVLENILLAASTPGLILDIQKVEQELQDLCEQYHLPLDLRTEVWQLSVGEQQWIEILKAIYLKARLLILDEPTSVLTPQEIEILFNFLRKMRAEGLSILLITHKLEEVMQLTDRVTVLRRGKKIGTVNTTATTKEDLARMMVGREVVFTLSKEALLPGKMLLEIKNLHVKNDRNQGALNGVSFALRTHEILGIAGVTGNGQRELIEALIGVREIQSGQISLNGLDITSLSTDKKLDLGMGHVPEDRIQEGLIMEFSVAENLILGQQRNPPYRRGLFLDNHRIEEMANRQIAAYEIATPSPQQKTKFLSGGNLQKVILARELEKKPSCLLVNQPTRGLDVGVIQYVHSQLLRLRQAGAGILLISEDLDELLRVSDRIVVLFKGQIMGIFNAQDAQLEKIGLHMAGILVEEKDKPV